MVAQILVRWGWVGSYLHLVKDTSKIGAVREGVPDSLYWRAFTAESTLAAQQIAAAGPALGKLDPTQIGSFYAAFFPLSIAYERMAKIALHVDRKIATGEFIPSTEMGGRRGLGHDLVKLFDRVAEVCDQRGYDFARPVEPAHDEILSILTEFAGKGRYNHLDSLASTIVDSKDAEREWDERVLKALFLKHATHRTVKNIIRRGESLGAALKEITDKSDVLAFCHDVNGATHIDPLTIQIRRDVYRCTNRWARMYAFQLGRWLAKVLGALSDDARATDHARAHVPDLMEFFRPLNSSDQLLRERHNIMSN